MGSGGAAVGSPGHDLNYLAITGLLHAIGPADGRPVPPLNLVGDYGSGGMLLAFGIVSGLLEASRSQRWQVLDAAMVDGVSLLGSNFHGLRQVGAWHDRQESNRLDGGAPFYGTYETSDAGWVAIAANGAEVLPGPGRGARGTAWPERRSCRSTACSRLRPRRDPAAPRCGRWPGRAAGRAHRGGPARLGLHARRDHRP
jgi:CoA-transferase family III